MAADASPIPTCAPLAIFAFNRPGTFEKVLDRLSKCDSLTGRGERVGYAFLDGAREGHAEDVEKIAVVRELIERFKRDHFPTLKIVVRPRNYGNTENMPQGISEVLDRHGRIIVVEDDILVSRCFLEYMDEALERYANDPRIWCINAWRNRLVKVPSTYRHDVYLTPRAMCWGWGTWKDRWAAVDFKMQDWPEFKAEAENIERLDDIGIEVKWMLDEQYAGKLKAWDVQCVYHMAKNGLYAVEPRLALTKNIGFGTDCDHCSHPNVDISTAKYYDFRPQIPDMISPDRRIYGGYRYGRVCPLLFERIKRKVRRLLWSIGPSNDEPKTCFR